MSDVRKYGLTAPYGQSKFGQIEGGDERAHGLGNRLELLGYMLFERDDCGVTEYCVLTPENELYAHLAPLPPHDKLAGWRVINRLQEIAEKLEAAS